MKNVKILWDNDAIEKKIKEMAKNITTKWENEPVVNLIPVITGGMIFATKLIFFAPLKTNVTSYLCKTFLKAKIKFI